MGSEATCEVHFGDRISRGRALLETDALIFRGEFRLSIALKEITAVEAGGGALRVTFAGGQATFHLGPQAEKWALKIRHPRTLVDKLGAKPGMTVAFAGAPEAGFRQELESRGVRIAEGAPGRNLDLIFLQAEADEALTGMQPLPRRLKPNGAIWVIYPKGQRHITENGVLAAGRKAGLVDIKVASFSPTHTALKFVIPAAKRSR